jgi:4-hydroxybenzoate polyprenyltransferase
MDRALRLERTGTMSDGMNQCASDFNKQRFAYEMLRKEIEFRRDKAWRIFSWASTILLGVIGGVVAIASKSELFLPWLPHRTLLLAAIIVLAVYSCLWIQSNLDIEDSVSVKIKSREIDLGLREGSERDKKRPRFGYIPTLVLLTIGAILALIFVPLSYRPPVPTPPSTSSPEPRN